MDPSASTAQITEAMLDAKNSRRRAECDVQLLANRLAHLRQEEAKAQRKISETKRRAGEIVRMKKRNADNLRRKELEKASQGNVIGKEQQSIAMRRKKAQNDRNYRMKDKISGKLAAVRKQKEIKARNAAEIKQRQQEEILRKKRQKALIKHREAMLKAEKERKEKEKREKQRRIYLARLEEERKKREAADRQIEQMEAEEMRLIERLRATQEAQRNAYEQLELALAEEVVSTVEKK